MTNGARTIKELRAQGYIAESVEQWNSWAKQRKDLFGFVDVVACMLCVRFIQCTSRPNMSARIKKIKASPYFATVKWCGIVEVWGWYKEKNRWKVKITRL